MNVVLWWHTKAKEMTLMLWKMFGLKNQPDPEMEPLRSSSMAGPRNTTIDRITLMLASAIPLALASFEMSLVSDSGNETHVIQITISVLRDKRKSTADDEATWLLNSERSTCGMVSPMITANPMLPPNPNSPWASKIATFPRSPNAWLTKAV
ncbi:hypothetical protein OGAPHI_006648 [Ogataea philodendri]|uniref:Uncharacterized protein n=1 Tax=Ogataea philodendri TaxID=1378263 RepID=A0A9P8NXX2_9ASCO|nr:uncharacterized protein OGAPHI_006648 [Ogataea philodendri]KAH3661241.1 hypothetical protein OGAPHI_006648 [Ogataea philodendri]